MFAKSPRLENKYTIHKFFLLWSPCCLLLMDIVLGTHTLKAWTVPLVYLWWTVCVLISEFSCSYQPAPAGSSKRHLFASPVILSEDLLTELQPQRLTRLLPTAGPALLSEFIHIEPATGQDNVNVEHKNILITKDWTEFCSLSDKGRCSSCSRGLIFFHAFKSEG